MRLYKLTSRHGDLKRRPWPWFEAPAVGAPVRYAGWVWDPKIEEWVKTQIDKVKVVIKVPEYPRPTSPPRERQPAHVPGWWWNPGLKDWEEFSLTLRQLEMGIERGPKPLYPPGPSQPYEVEGWSWSKREKVWVATKIIGQPVEFTPPPTLPPGVQVAGAPPIFPTDEQYIIIFRQFMDGGMSWEHANRMVDLMRSTWTEYAFAKQMPELVKYWREVPVKVRQDVPMPEVWGSPVLAYILYVTLAGVLIGLVADQLITPDDPAGSLRETEGTYLLGPGNWAYSKHVGTSLGGVQYFSACGDIGTEYVRHKRALSREGYDRIDFPGGFLEKGYQAPYWVKYRWRFWSLKYVGMLESCGERFYRLKECDYNPYSVKPLGWMLKSSEWCKNLRYYL